jgi:hypothetical protein
MTLIITHIQKVLGCSVALHTSIKVGTVSTVGESARLTNKRSRINEVIIRSIAVLAYTHISRIIRYTLPYFHHIEGGITVT